MSIPLLEKVYKVLQSSSSFDFALWGGICYTSKSLIAMMASVVVTNIASVAYWYQVSQVSQTLSCLCRPSNDIVKTLKTPQRLVLKNINQLTRSTSLLPLENPLKSQNWKGALPYILSRSVGALYPLLGERFNALCPFLRERWPFLGKIWFVGGNQGRIPSISEGGWIRI
jgi:hypothetical protein